MDSNGSVIKLCVPIIYEENYIDRLISLNNNLKNNRCMIYEVYGSLPEDMVGNLRPRFAIGHIDIVGLKECILRLHEANILFDYVINSTIMPTPFDDNFKIDFCDFIQTLVLVGIDSLTISNPYLIIMVKASFPNIRVNASICNEISTVRQVKEFDQLNADVLVLDRDINRNFYLLRKIRASTKKDLKVLCNSLCLYQCINVQYHANYTSSLSNCAIMRTKMQYDQLPYCSLYCRYKRFIDPIEHLKSQWIRPEDMHYYAEIGINEFKIDGRDRRADYILEVIAAYISQKYDGNLFHLMQSKYPAKMEEILQADNVGWKIGIQNHMLTDFLQPFVNESIICTGDCLDCQNCNYWGRNIVINKERQKEACEYLRQEMEGKL